MKGSKYLSEVIDRRRLYCNMLNVIQAPTGCGKTFFALETIPTWCIDAEKEMLFVIDTINGKEQILKRYYALPATRDWIEFGIREGMWITNNRRVRIMTYACLGCILEKIPNFLDNFWYLVCDELHNLPVFANYSQKPNAHTIAIEGIKRAVENEKTTVIAFTATPRKVYGCFPYLCSDVLFERSDLRHYETKQEKKYYSIKHLLSTLDKDATGLCYAYRVTQMKEIESAAAALGLRPIPIWSINNSDHKMNEEQLRVRDSVLQECTIPSDYNLLIINSSSETSIKIKSKVDYVIVHSSNKDTQVQARGRVDNDLNTLYIPSKDLIIESLFIPDEFLGVRLFEEDKKRLCKELDIRNQNNRRYEWRKIKELLADNHYNLREGRQKNRRYSIITLKD